MTEIRVLLADDHPVVREGLRYLIDSQPDMHVVGEAVDGEKAWEVAKLLLPDVLVMDISMPGMGGIEATRLVRRDCPDIKVVGLTVQEERQYVDSLLAAGASGYVLKRSASSDLVRAVRTVCSGGTYIDPFVAGGVVGRYLKGEQHSTTPAESLSEREREVLVRIAQGFSNKEIASALNISVKTVETYKARLCEKLGLQSRVDIVRYASARGWLDVSEQR